MPLTKKGVKVLAKMRKTYGAEKGKQVFYASANKGKIRGVEKGKKHRGGRKGNGVLGYKKLENY